MKIKNPLKILYKGYLHKSGWLKSLFSGKAEDVFGKPLPWLTLPFINYFLTLENLKKRFKNSSVFEYGAGQSTLFFSKYFKHVDSVEHDLDWYNYVSDKMPKNVSIIHRELSKNGVYARSVKETGRKYDVIIVDGRDRVNCLKYSLDSLKKDGIIILDNSERTKYRQGIKFIKGKGFKSLEFWGVVPGGVYLGCTTVFYKDNNVFKI